MIEYVSSFYGGEKRPIICKKFTSSSGEESHTAINIGNEEDRDALSPEIIYEHINNVLKYLDDKIDTMTIIPLDNLNHNEPWPIIGWSEVEWCQNEMVLWWNYVYYKDYDDRLDEHIAEETAKAEAEEAAYLAAHEEESFDHTHDPDTGEEIPNEPTTTEETPA